MSIKQHRYKIYEYGKHVGYFNVKCIPGEGRFLTADLFDESESFLLLPDKEGHVSEKKMDLWLTERIVPRTRVGIDDNLKLMGLSEYDELGILKWTEGRHASDTCYIDFSEDCLCETGDEENLYSQNVLTRSTQFGN